MNVDQLLAEGRRLARPTTLLAPESVGERAAIWYGLDHEHFDDDGFRFWLSVNTAAIPNCELRGWLSVLLDEKTCQGGRVQVSSEQPELTGDSLYAHNIDVLPPIDAVIARGSPAIDAWLERNGWPRDERYNSNFADADTVDKYLAVWQREHPLYSSKSFATLGGWHMTWADHDWHQRIDEKLLIFTYRDAEPWVETWKLQSGAF